MSYSDLFVYPGFFGVITGTSQAIIKNRSVYQYAKVVGSRSILIAAAFGCQ
jgi:hypothetical protein